MTQWLRRLLRREDGTATVEFVILVPLFFTLFMSSFELGMALTRQMMLDRALDIAVRQVRLGAAGTATHDALRDLICRNAMIPDCRANLRVEMTSRDPRAWSPLPVAADCVNRANPAAPATRFNPTRPAVIMVVRACALFDPYFPTTGLGAELRSQNGGAYALASSSAFVVEPERGSRP